MFNEIYEGMKFKEAIIACVSRAIDKDIVEGYLLGVEFRQTEDGIIVYDNLSESGNEYIEISFKHYV